MSTLLIVSNAILWVALLGIGFLLWGTLRSLGLLNWRLDELEATRPVRKEREGLKVGVKAPWFELPDLEGAACSLADFAGRQRLLVFVQPGCGPCHDIVPELNDLHKAGKIQVIGIINGDETQARQWADEVNAKFPVLRQEKWAISKIYKTFATPFGYLLDEKGLIVSRGLVGNSQYLQYVLTGAANESKTHQPETQNESQVADQLDQTKAPTPSNRELTCA